MSNIVRRCSMRWHKQASLTLAQTVYAMARNLACQWGKNSWPCAWGCAGVRWNACQVVARILRCLNFSQGVTTKLSFHFREKFVNYKQTRRNYWVTRRANACRDVNILKFSPRPGTHPHPHPSPTHTHCHEFFPHWHATLRGVAGTKFIARFSIILWVL